MDSAYFFVMRRKCFATHSTTQNSIIILSFRKSIEMRINCHKCISNELKTNFPNLIFSLTRKKISVCIARAQILCNKVSLRDLSINITFVISPNNSTPYFHRNQITQSICPSTHILFKTAWNTCSHFFEIFEHCTFAPSGYISS